MGFVLSRKSAKIPAIPRSVSAFKSRSCTFWADSNHDRVCFRKIHGWSLHWNSLVGWLRLSQSYTESLGLPTHPSSSPLCLQVWDQHHGRKSFSAYFSFCLSFLSQELPTITLLHVCFPFGTCFPQPLSYHVGIVTDCYETKNLYHLPFLVERTHTPRESFFIASSKRTLKRFNNLNQYKTWLLHRNSLLSYKKLLAESWPAIKTHFIWLGRG